MPSLCRWRYCCAHTRNKVLAAEPTRSERRSREKVPLPVGSTAKTLFRVRFTIPPATQATRCLADFLTCSCERKRYPLDYFSCSNVKIVEGASERTRCLAPQVSQTRDLRNRSNSCYDLLRASSETWLPKVYGVVLRVWPLRIWPLNKALYGI